MRILNVAQTYFPYVAEGGRPAKVRALSRKLAEHGHSVTVLSANLGLSEWSSIAYSVRGDGNGLPVHREWCRRNLSTHASALSRSHNKSSCDTILPGPSQTSLTSFTSTVSTICLDQLLATIPGVEEFPTWSSRWECTDQSIETLR